jgi:hypothetical protein
MSTSSRPDMPRAVVDGLLVEIGQRLFRPRRGMADDGAVRPGAGSTIRPMSASEVRAAVRDFVRPGSRQVMVKVTGGGRGMRAMAAHLRYISRQGQDEVGGTGRTLEVIDERGESHRGREAMQELIADWRTAGSLIPQLSHRREAFHIIFSMPAGTRSDALLESVQATARELYDGHRYVMAMHLDQGAPHVHVMVRAEGLGHKRLNPRKADLDHWRATFARQLQARGIDAVATRQAARLVNRAYPALWEKRAAEDGRLRRERGERKTGDKALQARMVAARGWRVVAQVLAKSTDLADRQLAADIEGVFRQMERVSRGQEPQSPRQHLGQAQSGRRITDQDERSRREARRGPER